MSLVLTSSAHFANALLRGLNALGWPEAQARAALVQTLGHSLDDPAARIPASALRDLFDLAEARLDDPLLGLRLGFGFRIATYGTTGAIYAHARDLADVVDLNARYQRLAIDLGDIALEREEGRAHMTFQPHYSDFADWRHVSGFLMAAYGTAYRWLSWGSGAELAGVALPGARPEGPEADALLARIFGCPVTAHPERGHLAFSRAAMAGSLPTHDAEKRLRAVATMDAMLELVRAPQSRLRAVRAAMEAALDAGAAMTSPQIGTRCGLSERELRAALKEAGTDFRAELDAVRRERLDRLRAQGNSFAQIAQALGYNDQAAFTRAHKRWYGVTPSTRAGLETNR